MESNIIAIGDSVQWKIQPWIYYASINYLLHSCMQVIGVSGVRGLLVASPVAVDSVPGRGSVRGARHLAVFALLERPFKLRSARTIPVMVSMHYIQNHDAMLCVSLVRGHKHLKKHWHIFDTDGKW